MKKKEDKKPSSKMKGKMAALQSLHKMASDMMSDDMKGMKGMKKVSVMAKDKKGLKKGLEKAESMLGDDDSSEC